MVKRLMQVLPVISMESKIQVQKRPTPLVIENHVDEIWWILRYANGQRTFNALVEVCSRESGYKETVIRKIISDLEQLGVLADSRALYRLALDLTDNPMPYASDMRIDEYSSYEKESGWVSLGDVIKLPVKQFSDTIRRRYSCRSYTNDPIDIADLGTILSACTYRLPSAGALFPIRLSVVVNKSSEYLDIGVYHYDPKTNGLIRGINLSEEEIRFALNREDGIHNSPVVIVVSGDMERQSLKYANRGWRYTLIEAGMTVERIVNAATDLNLGSLVFGGYDDVVMSRYLFGENAHRVRTLATVAIGVPSKNPSKDLDLYDLHNVVDASFVGEDKLIEGTAVTNSWRKPGDLSFHQVLATFRPLNANSTLSTDYRICGGTAASIMAARTKAIIECVERAFSGKWRVDRIGSAITVNPSFDINDFTMLSRDQIEAHDFLKSFDKNDSLEWVTAEYMESGKPTLLPIDLVYYPLSTHTLGRPLLVAGNSSGVASHTDSEIAKYRALLEIIERHAILIAWHKNQPPAKLASTALTPYLQNRKEYWRRQDYDLEVLDLSLEGVPIAGVVIGSDTLIPNFSFGSAAGSTWIEAVNKALHEAEVGMAGYRSSQEVQPNMNDVVTPLDHGRFHAFDRERVAWNFLRSGTTRLDASTKQCCSLTYLTKHFRPICVRIDSPDPIKTYRVLSPVAFPISFGWSLEHRPSWSRAPLIPHFIA